MGVGLSKSKSKKGKKKRAEKVPIVEGIVVGEIPLRPEHQQEQPERKRSRDRDRSRSPKSRDARSSLYRVGDKSERDVKINKSSSDEEIPRRARTSTYGNVRDAVMRNITEAERSKHDQSVPMGVIGLRNLGNTCFLNSSLQCLSATIPLTDYFLGYDYRSEINKGNFLGTGGKLVTAYAELMKKMWLGRKSVAEPSNFKQQIGTFAPQFNGFHQHDSQELLGFLLDGIHEDLNRVKKKPYIEDKDCDGKRDEEDAIGSWKNYLRRNRSLVVDLFQGQLKNTCKCLTCGHKNIRFEPFMYLSLPITRDCRSIDDCMGIYLEEEILKGADQWYCGNCKTHVDATKKTDLWITPPILIVHLKRFRYNDFGKVGSKNDASIKYPIEEWDLKSRVHSKGGVYPMYDLYAVSNHVGNLGGGHYTALALNRFDDEWYEFNDSSYRCVEESIHRDHRRSAYVLFYNRSEGDTTMPLHERAPVIRRQSVSRPDLWPHTQLHDPTQIRSYTRMLRPPDSSPRKGRRTSTRDRSPRERRLDKKKSSRRNDLEHYKRKTSRRDGLKDSRKSSRRKSGSRRHSSSRSRLSSSNSEMSLSSKEEKSSSRRKDRRSSSL